MILVRLVPMDHARPTTPLPPWGGPPTHQTVQVWAVQPGRGETQGHVRAALSHLSLKVVVGPRGEVVAAVITHHSSAICWLSPWAPSLPTVTPTPPSGQEVGGGCQANVPHSPWDLHAQTLGEARKVRGRKSPVSWGQSGRELGLSVLSPAVTRRHELKSRARNKHSEGDPAKALGFLCPRMGSQGSARN